MVVDEVGVADLCVEQANRLANAVGDASADEEVLVPVLLREALAERAAEETNEPGLAGVVLVVDVDELREAGLAGDEVVQGRVGGAGGEAGDLLLRPLAAKDGDDGGAAGEQWRGVARGGVGLEEGLAVEVGEEEGELGLEEARGRDEGLALVELEVAPVAEVGTRDLGGPRCASSVSHCSSSLSVTREPSRRSNGSTGGWQGLQLFSPLQVLVVVDKVLLALLKGAGVDARVLAGLGGQRHADGPGQGLGDEVALDALAVGARGLDGGAGDGALGVEGGSGGGLVCAGGARRGRGEAASLLLLLKPSVMW